MLFTGVCWLSAPRSQDHRALPEIPSLLQGVMQTDDEEEDDGHYDVISGNKRARGQAPQGSSPAAAVKSVPKRQPRTGRNNPYERVSGDIESDGMFAVSTNTNASVGVKLPNEVLHLNTNPDYDRGEGSDSTYAGIRDSSPSASSVDVGEMAQPPQQEFPVVADITYAQIEDKQGRARQRPQHSQPPEDPAAVYAPPPVPHKNYEPGEDIQSGNLSTSLGPEGLDLSNSPSLPPRNGSGSDHSRNGSAVSEGAGVAVMGLHLYETPSDPGPSAAGEGGVVVSSTRGTGPTVASDIGAAGAAALPCFTDSTSQSRYQEKKHWKV